AIARLPLFSIDQIGDAPVEPLPAAERPLAGVNVLDLTRIIAGPVCGRTLAAHGADVLLITAAHLPSMQPLVVDNGRGKLSASMRPKPRFLARASLCPCRRKCSTTPRVT